MEKQTGHTATQGWEIGVRRTFPLSPDQAWELLFSQPVLGYWLDNKANLAFQKGDTYTTAAGITITVSSCTIPKVIRIKWHNPAEENTSTLQIRVIPAKEKATISFHHEWLKDATARVTMQAYWRQVLDQIDQLL
ncbi:SRPBCC domain-containing protein [Chitinophaga nivalis]|uniref:SRPBCC domain-containing protein n=1 Tax=Chitinophaga nivalis TaxID=2991709 RepID=A0ABT3ISG1_9BACT|nr:SRPBCC domain-containing protein [Chitinophaga nivalis]MCW3463426.1 SRPBCC domain-containing protein [Chitinophaga nivalis]MCW3486884.1 SRPBCC domain-containing protein [Chitinophaga nivalis]